MRIGIIRNHWDFMSIGDMNNIVLFRKFLASYQDHKKFFLQLFCKDFSHLSLFVDDKNWQFLLVLCCDEHWALIFHIHLSYTNHGKRKKKSACCLARSGRIIFEEEANSL